MTKARPPGYCKHLVFLILFTICYHFNTISDEPDIVCSNNRDKTTLSHALAQHLLSVPLVNVSQFRTSQEARANQIKRGCTAYFLFPESVSEGKGKVR